MPAAIVVATDDPARSAPILAQVRAAWPDVRCLVRTLERPLADGACSARDPVAVIIDAPPAALEEAAKTLMAHAADADCVVGLAFVDRGIDTLPAATIARLDARAPVQFIPGEGDARSWRRQLHAALREALESDAYHQMAGELRHALDTLRLAQHAGRVGVFDLDLVSGDAGWSDGMYSLYGVPQGEPVTQRSWSVMIHPDDVAAVEARVDAILGACEPEFDLEYRAIRRDDGAVRWLWSRGRIAYDADGHARRVAGTQVDVTHERLAREATDRAEARLLAMYDAAEAGIVHAGTDGRMRYVNGAFCRIVGRDAHEMLGGMTVDEITDPEDVPLEHEMRARHAASGAPFDYQKRFVRPDGTPVWVHLSGGMVRDASGAVVGAVAIVVDITARRVAEQALRDSGEQLRQAASLAGLVSGELDLLTGEVTASAELATFLGLRRLPTRTTLPGILAAIHDDDRVEVVRRITRALDPAGDGHFESEHRFVARARQERWHQVRGVVRFEDGAGTRRPVRLLFTAIDVTARRRQEEEGRVREQRLALALGALRGLVYDWDARTGTTTRSGEMTELLGWAPHEVPDDVSWWHQQVHPDDHAQLLEAWLAIERGERDLSIQEYRVRHRDGRWVWVWDHSRAIRDRDGSVLRLIGCTVSVDDRKKAEERIEAARREAEAASAAKDRFLAVLSHELRTPLAPVALLTTMLQRRAELPRDVHTHLATIRRNVELEIKLIDDLLDLTRIARGKLELRVAPVPLGPAIDEVLAMVAADADARQLRLVRRDDGDAVSVAADSGRLQQMLWNIVRNAVKFTPACGTVTIAIAVEGDVARVTVTDTGIGIPADQLEKVFDPFVQADAAVTREFGGLGLGLHITRALAQAHGGDVSVHSDGPGTGAAFTLALPVAVIPDMVTTTAELRRDALATTRGAGARLLLVEDHPDTAAAVAMLLRTLDFEPVVAHSVAEGLRRFHADRSVAAVITDLGLPDGSGADLLQHLQAHYGADALPPCLVMSGFGMQHDIERSLALGFAAHLVKPVSSERLAEALGQALARVKDVTSPV